MNENTTIVQIPSAAAGMPLSTYLAEAGIVLPAPCGGHGTCGKCRVQVRAGWFYSRGTAADSGEKLPLEPDADGYVLACQAICSPAGAEIAVLCFSGDGLTAIRMEQAVMETESARQSDGIALDIGTTTLAAAWIHGAAGQIRATASCLNPQQAYGADVISRIEAANAGKLSAMQSCVIDAVRDLIEKLSIAPETVRELPLIVSGNTTMLHLFCGVSPAGMGTYPFTPAFTEARTFPGDTLCLPVRSVTLLPSVSAFVGGDVAAGMFFCRFGHLDAPALLLDIGTNGELVLGCREFLLMGAGAAGPALEGAVSRSGMRAEPGAICRIKIGPDNRLRYETVGGLAPKGICGSGILDLIAEGFLSGWIDSAGNLQKSASPCIRDVWDDTRQRNVPAIIYAYDGNVPLYFTQDDIGEFLTCKAAAHTMVATLLESVNVSPSEIGAFYLAGGFGTHYDLESAITVGLYPDLPREKFKILGNSSLAGAKRLLLDTGCRARLDQIRALATYVQFGEMEKFVENMQAARFLPHTDASRYPSVMRRLRERGKTFPPGKLAAERSGAD